MGPLRAANSLAAHVWLGFSSNEFVLCFLVMRSHPPIAHMSHKVQGHRLAFSYKRLLQKRSDVPLRQPLDLAEVLAKLATVLDRPRSSRSLDGEFGVDPDVATTETEYTEDLNGGGSAMPRCSALNAPVTNTLELSLRRTRRECGKI